MKTFIISLLLFAVSLPCVARTKFVTEEQAAKDKVYLEKLEKLTWVKFPVQNIEFLKKLFISRVDSVFVRRNPTSYVPPVQALSAPAAKDFALQRKKISEEILRATSTHKNSDKVNIVRDQAFKFKRNNQIYGGHYLETQSATGTDYSVVTCFAFVKTKSVVRTFFTQAFTETLRDCPQQLNHLLTTAEL